MVDNVYEMWTVVGVVMTVVLPLSVIIIVRIAADHYKVIALEHEKTRQLELNEKIVNGRPISKAKARALRAADEEV